FFGVEEVAPCYDAYAYLYVSKESGSNPSNHYVRLDPSSDFDLRIFRRTERVLDPPIKDAFEQTVMDMQAIIQEARDPNAREPIAEAFGDMYFWVSEQIRDWFLETQPINHWPTE